MDHYFPDDFFDKEELVIFFLFEDPALYSNNSVLISVIQKCFGKITRVERKKNIEKLLTRFSWFEHYCDKNTGRRVLSQTGRIEHDHEVTTATRLTQVGYDVIFAPGGLFTRDIKKFDVLLIRDTIIHKADLKCITSKIADTIAKRIKDGSEQASRVVVDINSNLNRKDLIDGLRSGVERNSLVNEILLLYKHKCYRLNKNQILGREISEILK